MIEISSYFLFPPLIRGTGACDRALDQHVTMHDR
jgi:hypothetical protein